MKTTLKIFCGCSVLAIIAVANTGNAAVTQRQNTAATAAAANRTQNRTPSTALRMSTASSNTTETATVAITNEPEQTPVTTPATTAEQTPERVIAVGNKSPMFSDVLSEMGANATDSSDNALAETIRRQRALLDAQNDTTATNGGTSVTTSNACDRALRKCMSEKCGADFTKCASDSTTAWGNKMDSCRRDTECSGHEYTLLATEILADRNASVELSYYNSVVNCGNQYNNCIFGICGKTLEKCLAKSAGDSAIAKCKSIADQCKEQDSGLTARIMAVMGDMRTIATSQAQKDEKRLYELRDLMRNQCQRFGAMFDERTLDCVYTVNFFLNDNPENTLSSKKLYSGDTFQCTPDWFGIDITTYIENAQRLTRSQTSASAGAMGAGVGMTTALLTSGAISRAIDTQNADKDAKEACEADYGEWVSAGFNKGNKCDMTNAEENRKKAAQEQSSKKDDSSTGGARNPGNHSNACNNICDKAIKTIKETVKKSPYSHDAKTTKECANECLSQAQPICEQLNNKEYTAANGSKYQIKNARAEISYYSYEPYINCTWDVPQSSDQGISPTTQETQEDQTEEEDKSVDCSKYGKTNCQILHARKCWWNGSECVAASEKADTVDINLSVTDKTGKVALFTTLECNGKKTGPSTTVKLTKIPKDATCEISAELCETKTNVGAQNLSGQQSYQLTCKEIDDCNGTWQRNKNNNKGTCVDEANKNVETSHTATQNLNSGTTDTDGCFYGLSNWIYNKKQRCPKLKQGEWVVKISNEQIKGTSICSITSGKYGISGTPDTQQTGTNCWCKITSSNTSQWVFKETLDTCKKDCAHRCQLAVRLYEDFRESIFSTNQQ